MNRRLRLALLLAALAAAGPSAVSPQAFETARVTVGIAWFRVTPASRPQQLRLRVTTPVAHDARVERNAQPDLVLPDTVRLHSLFQRPPPRHS